MEEGNRTREQNVVTREAPMDAAGGEVSPNLQAVFYAFNSFKAVAPPVILTMIISALAVVYLRDQETGEVNGGVQSPYLVLNESQATSTGEAVGAAALNALVIVGVICAATFCLVLCLYFELWWLIGGYIFFAITMILGVSTSISVLIGLSYYFVPVDFITFVVFFANFALGGVLLLFGNEANFWGGDNYQPFPDYLSQMYLVIISAVVAYIISTIFPFYTTWLLLVALALYDLCAVLTPCGPLNLLLQVAEKKGGEGKDLALPAALLYSTDVQNDIPGSRRVEPRSNRPRMPELNQTNEAGAPGVEVVQRHKAPRPQGINKNDEAGAVGGETVRNEEGRAEHNGGGEDRDEEYEWVLDKSDIKLGLGDFIFYSVLTSVSATFGFTACLSVISSVMMGLSGTLILLTVFARALPALPISIALGVTSYFVANIYISPFADDLAAELVSV